MAVRLPKMRKENKKFNQVVSKFTAAFIMFLSANINAFAANVMATDSFSFTVVNDNTAPTISNCFPAPGENNVPRTTNIKFTVRDDLSGIDISTVDLSVNGIDVLVNGVSQTYLNSSGASVQYSVKIIEKSSNEFVVVYDPVEYFDYKQTVEVVITADDLQGNQLQASTYSFKTQNFVHGSFKKLSSTSETTPTILAQVTQDNSCIQTSSDGKNVYIVWEELSAEGQWNIYFSRSTDFGDSFETPLKVNPVAAGVDHRYPAIDIDQNNNVYIAWQQQAQGTDWDIYVASLINGDTAFSDSHLIYNDSGLSDQLHPTIAVGDSLTDDGNSLTQEPSTIYVMWLDDNGTQTTVNFTRTTADYSDAWYEFVTSALRVDDDRWPQVCADPIIKIDADKDIFVAWRGVNDNGTSSIYFDRASSTVVDGGESFSADVVVSNATSNGKGPDIAVSTDGSNVFVLWKELSGSAATLQLYKYLYSQSQGIYELDLSTQVNQTALTEDTLYEYSLAIDSDEDAFVVWSYQNGSNSVINMAGAFNNAAYQFEEYTQFTTAGDQIKPCLATDLNGTHFYVSWTDNSTGENEISFLRNTFIVTDQIMEKTIVNNIGGTVSVGSGNIAGASVAINANAIDVPIDVTIAEIIASPEVDSEGFTKVGNTVDFGPGGTQFETAATITIPYTSAQLSSAGITDENGLGIYYYNLSSYSWEKVPGATVDTASRAVSVPTTHFSIYTIGYAPTESVETTPVTSAGSSGGGGGGGCFIATAAFGTKMAKEVRVLSEFRDKYLLTNYLGTKFVKFYYKYSPPIADRIRNNKSVKAMIRVMLKPLIILSRAICK